MRVALILKKGKWLRRCLGWFGNSQPFQGAGLLMQNPYIKDKRYIDIHVHAAV